MSYLPTQSWLCHQSLTSSHMIDCSRCRAHAPEAASIEAFAITGEGYFFLCAQCLVDFQLFITNQGVLMNPSTYFSMLADDADIDIAEHHWRCHCHDCVEAWADYEPDADEIVKGWREDRISA